MSISIRQQKYTQHIKIDNISDKYTKIKQTNFSNYSVHSMLKIVLNRFDHSYLRNVKSTKVQFGIQPQKVVIT